VKLSTTLLAALLQATGRQAARAALQAQDVDVPPTVLPVLSAVGQQTRMLGFSATTPARESFTTTGARTQPPSTGANTLTLCTFGQGMWRVFCELDSQADWTALQTSAEVRLQDPTGASANRLMQHVSAANVPQHTSFTVDLLVPDDGWTIQLVTGSTVAAQNTQSWAQLFVNRLL